MGLADLDVRIEKMEQAREDIVEATRAAHEVLKMLKQERREVQALIDSIPDLVNTKHAEMVDAGLKEYQETIKKAQDEIYSRVLSEMQKLSNIAMYGNEAGTGTNIFDAMRKRVDEYIAFETRTPREFRL